MKFNEMMKNVRPDFTTSQPAERSKNEKKETAWREDAPMTFEKIWTCLVILGA